MANPTPINPNHKFDWTPEIVQLLTERYLGGETASSIGASIGVSKGAVIGKANRLGLCVAKPRATPSAARLDAPAKGLCQWPHGHPRDKDFHFCAKPVKPAKSYCKRHCKIAYRPDKKRERQNIKSPFVWRA